MTHLSAIAGILDSHPDYRVLRRLPALGSLALAPPLEVSAKWKRAVVLDTETTSLDTTTAKIIELGVKCFTFTDNGLIVAATPAISWFEDPGEPLTPEITRVTGITDDMVKGATIYDATIEDMARDACIIIAHKADFDRPIAERRFPWLADKHWACSQSEIPWRDMGAPSSALTAIAAHLGYFYDAHRAGNDCEALATILSTEHTLRADGGITFLQTLLKSARTPTVRVWAVDSPFEAKDKLKARGYRWHDGKLGRAKSWFKDCTPETADAELEALKANTLCRAPVIDTFGAKTRYSHRALMEPQA